MLSNKIVCFQSIKFSLLGSQRINYHHRVPTEQTWVNRTDNFIIAAENLADKNNFRFCKACLSEHE